MRIPILLFASCLALTAATTVTESNIQAPDGSPASGTVLIRITAPCVSGSIHVVDKPVEVNFTGGSFSTALVRNDTCIPAGTSYTASWKINGGKSWNETWVISSAGPVTVDAIRQSGPIPTPPATISPARISGVGAFDGQALCFSSSTNTYAPGACPTGDSNLTFTLPLVRTVNAVGAPTAIVSTGTYPDPDWLTSLDYGKLANVPSLQPLIAAATTGDYWRGDKTFQSLSSAVRALISASSPLSYNSGTGVFTCPACNSGDASTNTSTSVDGEIALFSSTTGKVFKRATGTGYVKVTSGVMGSPAAIPVADLPAAALIRECEITIGMPGAASTALANDNDAPLRCGNKTGATMTITLVQCAYFPTGGSAPTITPIITGGSSTSILTGALACGSGTFTTGTLNGTPTEIDGASIDGNITVAGGTAKYIVIRIVRTL